MLQFFRHRIYFIIILLSIITIVLVAIFIAFTPTEEGDVVDDQIQPVFEDFGDILRVNLGFLDIESPFDFIRPSDYEFAAVRNFSENRQVFIFDSFMLQDPVFLAFRLEYPTIARVIDNAFTPIVVFYDEETKLFYLPDFMMSDFYEFEYDGEFRWVFVIEGGWYTSGQNFSQVRALAVNTQYPVTGFLASPSTETVYGISASNDGLLPVPRLYEFSLRQMMSGSGLQPEKNIDLQSVYSDLYDLEEDHLLDFFQDENQLASDGPLPIFVYHQTEHYIAINGSLLHTHLWVLEKATGVITRIDNMSGDTDSFFVSCMYETDTCFGLDLEVSELRLAQLTNQVYQTEKKVKNTDVARAEISATRALQVYRVDRVLDIRQSQNEVGFWSGAQWTPLSVLE